MTENHSKPVVVIIQPESIACPKFSYSKDSIFEKYFEINLSSNNCVCLVGLSDGKIMWTSFSLSRKTLERNTELQLMYDLKQPVANIHFMEKIENVEGHGFLLIIGSFGKLALLAAEKLFSNAAKVESGKSLYVVTSYIQVSIKETILFGETILYICRAGNLYSSKCTVDTLEKKELKISSRKLDLSGIISMVVVDKEIGLILLRTSIGNLYLAKYEAVETQSDHLLSLPTIMAQCLHQSTIMKELIFIQSLQRRFFAALTVFASLKHKGICFEEKFSCSASEIALSKKILLDVNLQSLKQLNLDPDLWSVAFSAHSCFCENYKVVSKTVPYSTDHPSLFIELNESDLQPSSASVLPLLIEVGLVLNIPYDWKGLDCFKLVEKSLPTYIRIRTFVVHEFYFLKKSSNAATIYHNWNSSRSILQTINEVAKEKPISNLLKSNIDILTDLPNKFQFCFPTSSIQDFLDKNQETGPCDFIFKILLKKSVRNFSQDNESLSCRNKPVTITVEKIESTILITLISKDLDLLLGMRMATLELLLSHQLRCEINPQTYVSIPGYIVKLCEEVSEKINYGKDIDSEEDCRNIIMLYTQLRKNISEKLPVL
ncbi:uncharacterized protein LOC129227586 [Uloborus diversus]|uniref:uncharacterized protein LOC129227586 n=1 Tax=Uloborus diversus TaxID=327109 RepID=UPI0024098144|nr:uncharacterized protein LOC129227586 [Uloborus diversus]